MFIKNVFMKNSFIKISCVISLLLTISCKKEGNKTDTSTTETIIQFKEIPFDLDAQQNELYFVNNKQVTLFASTDTVKSQIKTIENSASQRIFLVNESDEFYEVNYFLYGNNPLSYKGFVKKKHFKMKDEFSLESVDLSEIRYSNLKGVYNDQDKSFSKYGTIKLVSSDFYKNQKNKLVTNFITQANDISFNNETKTYSFQTNSGEQIEVFQHNDTEEGMPTYSLKGFSNALQRYVFEVHEDGEQYYAYYSKRRSDIEPLYTKSLPVYNKSNRHFAQLYNDDDVGALFIVQNLNNDFDFTEQLLVNFTNFKVKNESVYWISNNAVVAEVYHTNQTDKLKTSYVLIQFNI